MKLTKLMLALFAVCTMAACSKNEALEKVPNSVNDTNEPGLNLRHQGKENYWARCKTLNNETGQWCVYGGWGCGKNQNSPRCMVRTTPLMDVLERFSPEDLEFYYTGQLTSAFVQANMSIFQELYNLGYGDEPAELINTLRNAGR